MNWLKKMFKDDDGKKPIAAIGGGEVEQQAVDAVGAHANVSGKIKLNFKSLPKTLVQAMADETTGQTLDRKEGESNDNKRRTSLMNDFNNAARGITADQRDMERAPLAPPRPAAAPPRMSRPGFSL